MAEISHCSHFQENVIRLIISLNVHPYLFYTFLRYVQVSCHFTKSQKHIKAVFSSSALCCRVRLDFAAVKGQNMSLLFPDILSSVHCSACVVLGIVFILSSLCILGKAIHNLATRMLPEVVSNFHYLPHPEHPPLSDSTANTARLGMMLATNNPT